MTTQKQTPVSSEELMIGNWVYYPNGTWIVSGIIPPTPCEDLRFRDKWVLELNCNGVVNAPIDECSGIPLTPEMLEKCGFEKWTELAFSILVDNGWYIVWETNGYICLKYLENECEISHVEFKYLHQLQNLYHALTGSHLKVQL
jgi:hypothetical protein